MGRLVTVLVSLGLLVSLPAASLAHVAGPQALGWASADGCDDGCDDGCADDAEGRARPDPCETPCAGDDAEGTCPPGCDDCVCCGSLPLVVQTRWPALPGAATARCEAGQPPALRAPDGVAARVFRPPRPALS